MCGIAGYVGKNPDKETLKRMTDRIAHRGPDAEGFFLDDFVALGHRRLSIIDLKSGDQPIFNEDGNLVIIFNGEIYNYREIKKELLKDGHVFKTASDTEVLIHGYEKWGEKLCEHLRGMFAFAIWDKNEKRIYLARDGWGIKPLYYYENNGTFMFASEIKAFLDHPDFIKEFNEEILAAYLCFNSVPTSESFFKGVRRLEPGHFLVLEVDDLLGNTDVCKNAGDVRNDDKNKNADSVISAEKNRNADSVISAERNRNADNVISVERSCEKQKEKIGIEERNCAKQKEKIRIEEYFRLEFDVQDKTFDEYVKDIEAAMASSVKYHEIADVEVGSFLSSGIDSSYLVSLARPDKTYTVGYENPKYDEISYAKDLTKKLGINNTSRKITKEEYLENLPEILYFMDEPLADPAAIALYFVAEIASKNVKVVMSGEGADELFAGYNSYQEEVTQSGYMKIPYPIRRMLSAAAGLFPDARGLNFIYRRGQKLENFHIGLGRVFRDKEAKSLVKNKNQISTRKIVAPFYEKYKAADSLEKRQAIDFYFWLVKDFLHAVDRNTMMFSLEARTPYLDKEVYEVARHLPKKYKIDATTTKKALRAAAKNHIPNEAYKKKKLGFPVPLREWIVEEKLYNEIKAKFNGPVARKYFEVEKIQKMLEKQRAGKKDCYKKIWCIYVFILWYERFWMA